MLETNILSPVGDAKRQNADALQRPADTCIVRQIKILDFKQPGLMAVLFGALQIGAMWISLQPVFCPRLMCRLVALAAVVE